LQDPELRSRMRYMDLVHTDGVRDRFLNRTKIVQSIRNLKDQGLACIVISIEPETILDLCDRVLVFSRGRIKHEIKDAATSKSKLMELT